MHFHSLFLVIISLVAILDSTAGMGLRGFPFKRNLQLAMELDLDPGLMFRDFEAFLKEVANCVTSGIKAEYTTVCPPLVFLVTPSLTYQ